MATLNEDKAVRNNYKKGLEQDPSFNNNYNYKGIVNFKNQKTQTESN